MSDAIERMRRARKQKQKTPPPPSPPPINPPPPVDKTKTRRLRSPTGNTPRGKKKSRINADKLIEKIRDADPKKNMTIAAIQKQLKKYGRVADIVRIVSFINSNWESVMD